MGAHLFELFTRPIGAAVVDEENLITLRHADEYRRQAAAQLIQRGPLVEQRDNYRDFFRVRLHAINNVIRIRPCQRLRNSKDTVKMNRITNANRIGSGRGSALLKS